MTADASLIIEYSWNKINSLAEIMVEINRRKREKKPKWMNEKHSQVEVDAYIGEFN